MKFKRAFRIAMGTGAIAAALLVFGCSSEETETTEKGKVPTVAVTIVPQQTFVEKVCGDLAEVVVMVPPGSSPETYEPAPVEMEQFSDAEIYFSIGVQTEEFNILPNAKENENMKIVKLQERVAEVYDEVEIAPGERDPHIWLSPKRVEVMVDVIAEEMASIDPDNGEEYRENADRYIEELQSLDSEIAETLKGKENGKFIVFHPTFGYFADDYGLQMYSLEEEGKESTPQRLQDMIDFAKEEGITAVFYQSEISSQQAEAYAEEIGGEMIQLSPLSPDYVENMKNMSETIQETIK